MHPEDVSALSSRLKYYMHTAQHADTWLLIASATCASNMSSDGILEWNQSTSKLKRILMALQSSRQLTVAMPYVARDDTIRCANFL